MMQKIETETLKEKILDLAFSGKLVKSSDYDEQNFNSEINTKRNNAKSFIYFKDGRYYESIGKETNDITDEISSLHYPKSWELVRLSTICKIYIGNSINADVKQTKYANIEEGFNYIGTKDISFNHEIEYENGIKIPYDTNFKIAYKGSTLLCIEGGSAGRKIAFLSEDVCFGNKLCAFKPQDVDEKYIYYFLQSNKFRYEFKNKTNGIIGGVSINKIKELIIPLPPINEQKDIIKKIEYLYSEINNIESEQNELENLKELTKKKILDLAVCGKLVSQNSNDEPASVLLDKIKQEKEKLIKEGKIRKVKKDSTIYKGEDGHYYEKIGNKTTDVTDKIPFEIPNSWEFAKLESLCCIIPTKMYQINEKEIKKEGSIPVVSQGQTLIEGYTDNETKKIKVDTPIVIFGDHTKNVKYIDFDFVVGADGTKLLDPILVNEKWFYHLIQWASNSLRDRGYARHYVLLKDCLLPIPPLEEQKRIVDKLDQIFEIM